MSQNTTFIHQCSFCEATVKDVKHLILGPGVSICSECVELCAEIIAEKEGGEKKE